MIKNNYLTRANYNDVKPQPKIQIAQKHKSNKKTLSELKKQHDKMKQISKEESATKLKKKSMSDELDKIISDANKNINKLEKKAL